MHVRFCSTTANGCWLYYRISSLEYRCMYSSACAAACIADAATRKLQSEQQRRTRSLARSFAVSLAGFPSLELHNEERSGSQPSQSYIENSTKRRPK